jgi:hypothetical protein
MGSEALMTPTSRRSRRWTETWLRSDLVSIPLIVALVAIVGVMVAIFLLLGDAGGVFVDKALFPIAVGAVVVALLLLIAGRRRGDQSTEGVQVAPTGSPRRVLVIANRGLESDELCDAVCERGGEVASEARIVAPIAASSRLRALADDVDAESEVAQARLEAATQKLRSRGITAEGRVDVGRPMNSLLDGLREFAATEIVMLRGGEPHWEDAERFAEQVRDEVGIRVTEVDAPTA